MSLKAKIEAVIYASEEPVTLVQLVGLLGEEAQVELDELETQQASLALETAGEETVADDADTLNAETLTEPGEPIAAEPLKQKPSPKKPRRKKQPRPQTTAPRPSQRKPSFATASCAATSAMCSTSSSTTTSTATAALEVREVAGGFRLATKPEYHDAVRGFVKQLKPPMKLTLQALETLAVVAYKQPVTAPEISEIRGVDSAGVLGSLMARKLVTTAGRKQVIGRPILYKTTKDFLVRFGLKDIAELPSIEEFEKMAGELNDAVQEEIDMETPREISIDEINSAPEPTTTLHDSPEEMMSDKSFEARGRGTRACKTIRRRTQRRCS